MSNEIEQETFLVRSVIKNRRFHDQTLQILESVLASKDLKSLFNVRSSLIDFMRSESLSVMHEIAEKSVQEKLFILEFFVRAFALTGDVESCMALRYEALVLRELKSASFPCLQLSSEEWMIFAEQSLDNGFCSISVKACENAMLCYQRKVAGDIKQNDFNENINIVEKIKKLKDVAMASAASHSVQTQAAEYMKKRTTQKGKECSLVQKKAQYVASSLYRNGIKKQNERRWDEYQRLKLINGQFGAT